MDTVVIIKMLVILIFGWEKKAANATYEIVSIIIPQYTRKSNVA